MSIREGKGGLGSDECMSAPVILQSMKIIQDSENNSVSLDKWMSVST